MRIRFFTTRGPGGYWMANTPTAAASGLLPTVDVTCARVKPGLALRVLKMDASLAARRCGAGGRRRSGIRRPGRTQGEKYRRCDLNTPPVMDTQSAGVSAAKTPTRR